MSACVWNPCTCRHLHRYPSRSLWCSSSTTITRGDCAETTPSSAGRKGCGPSPDTKEAKPRKCCLSLLFAGSEKDDRRTSLFLFDQEWQFRPLQGSSGQLHPSRLCAAQVTFEHPQDDVPVVHAGSVEADCVTGLNGEGQRQGIDLAEGPMVPLCGRWWYCSQSGLDVLLNLLNWHRQLFMFQWVYPVRCFKAREEQSREMNLFVPTETHRTENQTYACLLTVDALEVVPVVVSVWWAVVALRGCGPCSLLFRTVPH